MGGSAYSMAFAKWIDVEEGEDFCGEKVKCQSCDREERIRPEA